MVLANFLGIHNSVFSEIIGYNRGNTSLDTLKDAIHLCLSIGVCADPTKMMWRTLYRAKRDKRPLPQKAVI
jgi:hypothetical protein